MRVWPHAMWRHPIEAWPPGSLPRWAGGWRRGDPPQWGVRLTCPPAARWTLHVWLGRCGLWLAETSDSYATRYPQHADQDCPLRRVAHANGEWYSDAEMARVQAQHRREHRHGCSRFQPGQAWTWYW